MRRIVHRVVTAVPVVLIVVTMTFVLVHAAPGSFADQLDAPNLSRDAREQIRQRWGLDEPLHLQYARWLEGLARGDLGISFLYRRPVRSVLAEALPPTILLGATALLIDLVLGTLLAAVVLLRPHGWLDRITSAVTLAIYGVPVFWLATVAILIFANLLGWLPPSHMLSPGASELHGLARMLDLVHHLLLPALCLGLVASAGTARWLRSAFLDARSQPHVVAARARGVPEHRVLWVHTVRPAILPLITQVGLSLPLLVSGTVAIEVVFSWPGMGQLAWRAATARDVPLVLGATLVGTAAAVVGNLVADLLYGWADPRAQEEP